MGNFKNEAGAANNAATAAGFWDTAKKAKAADQLFDLTEGSSRSQLFAKTGEFGLPGSGALNVAGGALSGLGFGLDVKDMVEHGIGVDNTISASGNLAGVVSSFAGSTPLGAATAGWALGTSTGQAGNAYARDKGFLGRTNTEYESAGNRGWDDMAADAGRSVRDALGGGVAGWAAGGLTTLGASVVGGVGAAGSAVASGAEGFGRRLLDLNHPLLAGVRGQVAAANGNAKKDGGR